MSAGSRYVFNLIRERMRRHPGRVLDFAFGQAHEPPPPTLLETLQQHPELALVRCSVREMEQFVSSAARMLANVYGVRVAPSAILPAPGGRAAMSALAACLVAPGDVVIVTEPGYPVFARLARQMRAEVQRAPLDPARGFCPDLGRPPAGDGSPVRLVALNYPNNPTGAVLAPPARAALGAALGPRTIWFNDATYGPLTYDGTPCSLLTGHARPPGVPPLVELHATAKLFPLGPLSLAFLVGDEAVMAEVRECSEFAWSPLSELQVRLGRLCLEDERHVERVRGALRQRIVRLSDALVALGFVCYPVQGGIYVLCRAPSAIGGRSVTNAADAAELLLSQYGLAVVPWDVPPHAYLRFSALYLPEDLEQLRALGEKLVQA